MQNITRTIEHINLDLIDRDPRQPRDHFNEQKLQELALSIRQRGLVQLPSIRPNPKRSGSYILIAGERRCRAMRLAGLSSHDFVVYRGVEEKSFVLSAVENLHREALNPIEEAKTLKRLHDEEGMSWDEVSELTGISLKTIHFRKRLLDLPDEIQQMVIDKKMPEGSARFLAQYKKTEKGKLILMALDLAAGKDPLEVGITGSPRSDKVIEARIPDTPEGQIRRALRSFWRSKGAIRALDTFLGAHTEQAQKDALRHLPANTFRALLATVLDLERVSQKFAALLKSIPVETLAPKAFVPSPLQAVAANPVPAVPRPSAEERRSEERRTSVRREPDRKVLERIEEAHLRAVQAAREAQQRAAMPAPAELGEAQRILEALFPASGHVNLSKAHLALILQQPKDVAEGRALWALGIARKFWRNPLPPEKDPTISFVRFITQLRYHFSMAANASMFPGFLAYLQRSNGTPDPINLSALTDVVQ